MTTHKLMLFQTIFMVCSFNMCAHGPKWVGMRTKAKNGMSDIHEAKTNPSIQVKNGICYPLYNKMDFVTHFVAKLKDLAYTRGAKLSNPRAQARNGICYPLYNKMEFVTHYVAKLN